MVRYRLAVRTLDDDRGTVQVPSADSSIGDLFEFALTFDGYGRYPFDELGRVANLALDVWTSSGKLPASLEELRMSLFFEQRRWRHFAEQPGQKESEYIRSIVAAIGSVAGGEVEDHRPISL